MLAGLLQLAIGYLKGGRLVRMLPHPVVLGFVDGGAQINWRDKSPPRPARHRRDAAKISAKG